jgi:hypothetical protein
MLKLMAIGCSKVAQYRNVVLEHVVDMGKYDWMHVRGMTRHVASGRTTYRKTTDVRGWGDAGRSVYSQHIRHFANSVLAV